MLTVQRMKRVELWSDLQAAGGQRLDFLMKVETCDAHVALNGDDHLTATVPMNDRTVPKMFSGRVIRTWQDDNVWDEWVITHDARQASNGRATVTCVPAEARLARAPILGQIDGLGVVRYDVPVVSLSPTEHLNLIVIPWLQAQGINWVSVGTIESAVPVDITATWQSPLDVIRAIAAAVKPALEFQFRRNGTVGYKIDLLQQIGSTAPVADFRLRKNVIDTGTDRSSDEQVTRAFPQGAAVDGEHATMGEARWQVSAVAGAVVTLVDPIGGAGPIQFDGQLNGKYLERPNGTRIAINASTAATQQVTLAVAGPIVGETIAVRADVAGTQLTYLDSPADVAVSGIVSAVIAGGDISATNNLVPNPALRDWPGALPTGWTKLGAGTVAKNILQPEILTGPASLQRVCVADGDGVLSPVALLRPTADRPYFSFFAQVWVVAGQVRVELVVTKADLSTVVIPIAPAIATSTVFNQFDALGVEGEDLNALTAISAQLRVVQNGATAATFYLDSGQLSQSPTHEAFVEGSGGTRLWQLANERLRTNGAPVGTYTSVVLDRARVDPATYAGDSSIVLGGVARVTDQRVLETPLLTRVVTIDRVYMEHGRTSFTLSNNPNDLSGGLTRPPKVPRVAPSVNDGGVLAYTQCSVTVVAVADDQITIAVTGAAPGGRVAQVRLANLAGATKLAGPAVGVLSASGQQWTFARPIGADVVQLLYFESVSSGAVTDAKPWEIPPQGAGVTAATCVITPTGTTATTVSFTVTADDPANGGSNATLDVFSAVGVTAPTPSPVTAAPPFAQAYTVTRPVFGNGAARVVFRTQCAGHIPGFDAVDIPPQDRDTQSAVVLPHIIAQDDTTVTIQVDGTTPNGGGTPVVRLVSINGNTTKASGANAGVDVASGSQWVFNRGAFQGGPGEVVFRAKLSGFEDNDKSVSIPEKLADTQGSLVAETKGADVVLSFSGPSTAVSARYAVSPSAMPTDATALAGTIVSGRQATVLLSNQVPNLGDRLYCKAVFFDGASGTGRAYPSVTAEVERQNKTTPKTFHLGACDFIATLSSYAFQFTNGEVQVSVASNITIEGALDLPVGSQITGWRWRSYLGDVNGQIGISMLKAVDGVTTLIDSDSRSASNTGYSTRGTRSVTETVASGFIYYMSVLLQAATVAALINLRLGWIEVDYIAALDQTR